MSVSQKMDRDNDVEISYTDEQLEMDRLARAFPWGKRQVPKTYEAVQLNKGSITASCLDWWNTRSKIFCCCFPLVACCAKNEVIDATDAEIWKKQLDNPTNPNAPDSYQGLWWLKDNIAHENLVTIFSDAKFVGTFNKEGTDGYGYWEKGLSENWSRDQSCFGLVLGLAATRSANTVTGVMNMKDGICTVDGGEAAQIIYRINDDEWWKVHYKKNEDGTEEIDYMYKWVKVLDKDGNKTKHWKEWEEWTTGPLPHKNCGTSWFPLWPICLSGKKKLENMIRPNKKQVVRFLQ